MAERLQKILAHAGIASRRAAEQLIADGHVRVNGKIVTELGAKADAHKDKIEVDGRRVVAEKPAYYLVHKPREMVTTLSDPEGRDHLGKLLKRIPERVYPVGRLDYHTSGALLVTNDGDLTDALLHPKRKVPKVYAAKLKGHLDVPELDLLRNGVRLDDGYLTKAAEVFVIREESKTTWVQITLHEGKNRQIHRMAEAIGHPVQRLVRLSFAGLDTEGLRPGEFRPLGKKELEKLEKAYLKPARADKQREAEIAMDEAAGMTAEARRGPIPRRAPRKPRKLTGPRAGASADARGTDSRSGDSRSSDSRSSDSRSSDSRSGGSRSGDSRSSDSRSGFRSGASRGAEPRGGRSSARSGAGKPAGSRAASSKSARHEDGGSKPAGRPSGSKSAARTDGAGARSSASKPSGSRPSASKPSGSKPSGSRPGATSGGKPGSRHGKPGGGKPSGGKPSSRPSGGKPSSKPGGGKPGGGKPGGRPSGSKSAGASRAKRSPSSN